MTPDRLLGNIERGDGRATLRFTRSLTHRPEKVWRALTESQHMRWWMPVDMIGDRAIGATVQMVFWPDLVEANGLEPDAGTATIEVWEPQRTLRVSLARIPNPIRYQPDQHRQRTLLDGQHRR